jgi:CspA family cold shock protein
MESKLMNYKDHYVTDESGNEVLFTVEMQRSLDEAGLPVELEYLDQLDQKPPGSKQKAAESSSQKSSQQNKPRSESVSEPASIQIDPMTGKYIGRIKWYNSRKGYGFILRGAGEEIFFHRSAAVDSAESFDEGLWILYDVEETKKGPEATDIEGYEGEGSE